MRAIPGVAADIFETLADAGINIEIISTSPIRISCVVRADEAERAVAMLHQRLRLADVLYEVAATRRSRAALARRGAAPRSVLAARRRRALRRTGLPPRPSRAAVAVAVKRW